MAIGVLSQVEGVTPDLYDQVNAKLGDDLPEGNTFHATGFAGSKMVIFDVWESREQLERWENEVLRPAIQEVAGDNAPTPEQDVFELHDLQQS